MSRNLSGYIFERWLVIRKAQNRGYRKYWLCQCQCNKKTIREVLEQNLISGRSLCCGCIRAEQMIELGRSHALNLIGKKFGQITVVSRYGSHNHKALWNCICNCTNKCIVTSGNLMSGNTISCRKCCEERARIRMKEVFILAKLAIETGWELPQEE